MFPRFVWRFTGLVLATGCGTAAPPADDAGPSALDDGAADSSKSDAKPDAKSETPGTESDGLGFPDALAEETDPPGDVSPTAGDGTGDGLGGSCSGGPGSPGCPCQENADCDVPICLPTAMGLACAAPCVENCPLGFKCVGVATSGGDTQNVCVDKWPHLCDPCLASSQCGAVGLSGAACVDAGQAGHYCGTACKSDADCPELYTCGSATSAEGNSVQQCKPKDGAVAGKCTCSAAAVADQLSTPCFVEVKDEKGAVVGQCKGTRSCGAAGLSECNATIQTEVCNGQDDDCDGQTDEGTCDDKNACTFDACEGSAALCSHTASPGACDADGNFCTVGDSCQNGKCAVGTLKSCDDGNACTTDACDPKTGCVKSNDDGLPCSDGSGCTVGDVCADGGCKSGATKVCPDGDACVAFACSALSGQCTASKKLDGTSCSDGTACTAADACASGACTGQPVNCDDGLQCTADTCDATAGCKHEATNTPCDDGKFCTENDTCSGKVCVGTGVVVTELCGDGNPCTTDKCDNALAACTHTNNSVQCDDGNSCTVSDLCAGGVCSGTVNCTCQKNADCAVQEDGNLCNGTLYCDTADPSGHKCKVISSSVVTCDTAADTPCSKNTCEPASGQCAIVKSPDFKPCDADGSVCTEKDSCQNGACVAGSAKACDDSNVCTDDSCSPSGGCVNTANISPCDADNNACTQNDGCSGKYCLAGVKKACDDGLDCTADACEPGTGTCMFDGAPKLGAPCEDGSVCSVNDKCDGKGGCAAGGDFNCDDGNSCTQDSCSAKSGCEHVTYVDKTPCDAAGGPAKWCVSGGCVKTPVCGDKVVDAGEDCDDGNQTAGDGCTAQCLWDPAQFPKPGELIISEIMFTSNYFTVSTFESEWIELYNTSAKPLLLSGLHFKDSSNNTAATLPPLPSGDSWVLQPGQYALLALAGKVGNYAPDWLYGSSFAFNNSGDLACISGPGDKNCSADIIAKLTFGSANKAGHSSVLRQSAYATEFASGSVKISTSNNWCDASKPIAGQPSDYGTPGFADPSCP